MKIIIISALFLSTLNTNELLKISTRISKITHTYCLKWMPNLSQNPQIHAALLCGENVTEAKLESLLIKTSLIHLFVVSGSHLVLVEHALTKLGLPLVVRFFLHTCFSLLCGWQAPIVRALFSFVLKYFSTSRLKNIPPDLLVLSTGLLCVFTFPQWTNSHSLIMSWMAALALATASMCRAKNFAEQTFLTCACVYFFMLPTIWGWGNTHPSGILFNLILAPVVGLILIPFSILSCISVYVSQCFDVFFKYYLKLSENFSVVVPIEKSASPKIEYLWILLFSIHIFIHFYRINLKRKRT